MPQRATPVPKNRRRLWWAGGATALAIAAGLGTWLLWPEPPRQFEFVDATACLLTDEAGITGATAQPVWQAMQESSLSSHTRVQYLSVTGPKTPANARAHLTALTGSQCGVIIAVGQNQTDAVSEAAAAFPQVRFVSVGGSASGANVEAVEAAPADSVRATIARRLEELADAAS
ncbi:hypothetical protein [Paractinoplanes lichenicola]|uniref:BMP family ABC transporter substrate-binding protein n=1 Tax=Paractinoplanes lichenicola TaxID=2802976 RepID=A0ABS1VUS1_9ACTN|nr:hypothetical protein [Actinoplanes lichenicola]MBL7258210.1 hypothetical protein [Actinoplanes lichenicola]